MIIQSVLPLIMTTFAFIAEKEGFSQKAIKNFIEWEFLSNTIVPNAENQLYCCFGNSHFNLSNEAGKFK